MIDEYIITVIIPTYNNAEYLERCLLSVINQSVKNIKIIIVDNGSTDNTSGIIQYYIKNYDNIECHITLGGGPGAARNIGIARCKTKYITFIDSDDWIDLNAYQNCINLLENNPQCDAAIMGILTEYDSYFLSQKRYSYEKENVIESKLALALLTNTYNYSEHISPLLGNKVYRSNVILDNKILFPETYFEDNVFMFQFFYFSKHIILVSRNYLHYYQRSNSIMHSFSSKHISDFFETFKILKSFLKNENRFSEYQKYYYAFFQRGCAMLLNTLFSVEQNIQVQKKYLIEFMKYIELNFDVDDLINNIDINLLKRIWGI
ncbi:hypothetical protein C805_00271 [Eubacterium sp. 14-2]|uniref:glycosyltransferase family 2 protein n=1 Tax=Eubacterium sp. 14-2 TaxID=1235790 RepID=UPI000338ED15|nr:glycosyltransferase family 2 protein [Eubacterium sp. 14-2]EOT28750.1 hypothetical protein C805_00271 [Eubacterium sp. 14-2]